MGTATAVVCGVDGRVGLILTRSIYRSLDALWMLRSKTIGPKVSTIEMSTSFKIAANFSEDYTPASISA